MGTQEFHIFNLPRHGRQSRGRLYYFQGNFFHPLDLTGAEPGLIRKGIRDFMRQHGDMVKRDRAHPEYRTLVQLAFPGVAA